MSKKEGRNSSTSPQRKPTPNFDQKNPFYHKQIKSYQIIPKQEELLPPRCVHFERPSVPANYNSLRRSQIADSEVVVGEHPVYFETKSIYPTAALARSK